MYFRILYILIPIFERQKPKLKLADQTIGKEIQKGTVCILSKENPEVMPQRKEQLEGNHIEC